jgi:hypothetical protein
MISGPARAMDECQDGPKADAARNEVSRRSLAWAPFGRPEIGWDVYEPLIAQEIGAACPAASPGFAAAVARWRGAHGLARTGEMDVATLTALLRTLQARRPFVALSRRACPDPPPQTALAAARVTEVYEGKPILLASDALQAYRAMLAAARAESPEIAADRRLLTIFSGFRSPAYDAARCLRDKNCFGITRAACSAHRTGLALDLYLGAAPGSAMDSSDDVNRDYLAHGGAYRWMVKNAARFGFVNYPFEPWHWEWTGGTKAPSQ